MNQLKLFTNVLVAGLMSICMLVGVTVSLGQQMSIREFVKKIPTDANAIMLVDVQAIEKSSFAKSEGWFESTTEQFESGLGFVPANSQRVVVASNVDQRMFYPKWTAAMIETDALPIYRSIRQSSPSKVDQALGQEFVELPTDTYVFSSDKRLLATYAPADRQHFVQWLRQLQTTQSGHDSYLLSVADEFDKAGNSLMFGVDLGHTYSQTRILDEVRDAEFLKKHQIDAKRFAELVSSVIGYSLAVDMDEEIQATIRVDFADEITSLRPVAHDLVLQILENSGMAIGETVEWDPQVATQSISINGKISTSSFRRIVSLLDVPEHDLTLSTAAAGADAYFDPGRSTKRYFDSVCSLVNDLRRHGVQTVNFVTNAIWFEKFAGRIDRLNTQNVDPTVLDFADETIKVFIDSATRLRMYGQDAKTETARLWAERGSTRSGNDYGTRRYSGYWNWGRRYYGSSNTGLFERRYAVQKVAAEAAAEIDAEFDKLQKQIVDLKRSLSEKYDMDF